MNSPQETIFYIRTDFTGIEKDINSPFVMMYHGVIVERHGLNDALRAIDLVRQKIPSIVFNVFGSGEYVTEFQRATEELRLQDIVCYHGRVNHNEIAEAIQGIDVGIIPNKKSPFTELNFPTRIFEYLSIGKPVIAPRTRGILDYFDDTSLFLFNPGDYKDLANVLWRCYSSPEDREKKLSNGMEVYADNRWEKEKEKLLFLVKELVN